MNNVINNNYNRAPRRENNIYNETFGERLVSFFCLVIAFFEHEAVSALCRLVGCALLAVGVFFYVPCVMNGTLSVVGTAFYGMILIAGAALVFRTKTVR